MSAEITTLLQSIAQPELAKRKAIFFKTEPGEYAEGDQFLGITVPELRKMVQQYVHISLDALHLLLISPYNEVRLLGLFILLSQYAKKGSSPKEDLYQFYIDHLAYVNNWNLVDSSAHLILGAHCYSTKNTSVLFGLTASTNLWHRRIAMVATWYFIKKGQYDVPIHIAQNLLHDQHDLIHKAVGWMLREIGKKDESVLVSFLEQYATKMPRTMLRYAIEKLAITQKKQFKTRN